MAERKQSSKLSLLEETHTCNAQGSQAGTLRHKYKILDALKRTWQIGIRVKDCAVKRSHKLLLASQVAKDFSLPGLSRRSTQEINSSALLYSTNTVGVERNKSRTKAVCHSILGNSEWWTRRLCLHPTPYSSLYTLTKENYKCTQINLVFFCFRRLLHS